MDQKCLFISFITCVARMQGTEAGSYNLMQLNIKNTVDL